MVQVKSRRYDAEWQQAPCPHCKAALEHKPPSPAPAEGHYEVLCANEPCGKSWFVYVKADKAASRGKKRQIGSDEKPLDLSYYEVLGITPAATTEEIKKAYRRLAIKLHPDKNINDPDAAEKFKAVAVAYSTLSDPGLRHTYNEFGPASGDRHGAEGEAPVDPEAVFGQMFGGERFVDIIGTISLGADMKSAMQADEDEEGEAGAEEKKKKKDADLSPEEKEKKDAKEKKESAEREKAREERVKKLLDRLRDKLALFTEQARDEDDKQIANGVKTMWSIEAEELKQESYGVELLHCVGFVYSSKSKHYLASTGVIPFGLGGWYHGIKSTAHIVSETVSTVRSAYALKDVFEAITAAEKSGLPPDKKRELEDKAAALGLQALFKGAALEIQSVIREVCDRILAEPNVPVADLRKRAVAIGILGDCFLNVKRDKDTPMLPGMEGYGSTAATPKEKPSSPPPYVPRGKAPAAGAAAS